MDTISGDGLEPEPSLCPPYKERQRPAQACGRQSDMEKKLREVEEEEDSSSDIMTLTTPDVDVPSPAQDPVLPPSARRMLSMRSAFPKKLSLFKDGFGGLVCHVGSNVVLQHC